MGTLSNSKYHVLASHGDTNFRNAKAEGKQRMKEKKHSFEESSSSTDEEKKRETHMWLLHRFSF